MTTYPDLTVVFPSDGDDASVGVDAPSSRAPRPTGTPLTVLLDEVERGDIIAGLTTPVDGMIQAGGFWVYADVHGRPICRRPNWGTVDIYRSPLAFGGPVTYGDDDGGAAA